MGVLSLIRGGATRLMVWGSNHSAALYTAVGSAAGVGAILSGIFVTPENTRILDNEKLERERRGEPPLTFWQAVKLVGPSYIPCILLGRTSVACAILNTLKEERKIATLAGLYSLSEKNFEEYRKKVEDLFGKNKERKVRDGIAEDKANDILSRPHTVILTGNGDYLCLDAWSNTLFKSSQLAIEKARIKILDELRGCMYMSLEEVYDHMDLPRHMDCNGNYLTDYSDIGFTVDDQLEFIYTYTGNDQSGEPMMVITFNPPPHPDFRIWR